MPTRARKSGSAERKRGGGRRSSPESAAVDLAPPDPVKARTALQEAFAVEFCVDHDQTAAYRRARGGHVGKAPSSAANKLFKLPQVQARIAELQGEQLGDAKRRKEIRIGTLMRTALDPTEKTSDRLRAVELSGKIDGDFVDLHEVTMLNEGRGDRMKRGRERASAMTAAAVPLS